MARLSYENRIMVRTSPDVAEGLAVLLARLQRAGRKFGGRKIGQEGLVGAVLLEFLAIPELEQANILNRRVPELERQLGLSEPPDAPSAEPAPEPPPIELVRVRELPPEAKGDNEHPRAKKRPRKT